MLNKYFISSIGCIIGLTGCATMFGDNNRQISVRSSPPGAKVLINGLPYGVTPVVATLPRDIYNNTIVTISKPGFKEQSKMVYAQFQPISLLNILNLGIGFSIDGAWGNLVAIDASDRNIEMTLVAEKTINNPVNVLKPQCDLDNEKIYVPALH